MSHCGVMEALARHRATMAGSFIMGLDINTASTGYAVLRVSDIDLASTTTTTVNQSLCHASLPAAAPLVECGRICTKHADDLLDGGVAIAQAMAEVHERCCKHNAQSSSASGSGTLQQRWLLGVEDFAESFTPGKFQTKGLFKLAQLNGVVKYSLLCTFGAKAEAWHATSVRSFYGLQKGKVCALTIDHLKVAPLLCCFAVKHRTWSYL